jgi:hypothetical protein
MLCLSGAAKQQGLVSEGTSTFFLAHEAALMDFSRIRICQSVSASVCGHEGAALNSDVRGARPNPPEQNCFHQTCRWEGN